ncbi:hypothetical protein BIV57_10325 [Mangrovactinospora gilvigrisea]|uniref:non-specific serine/threonine protein kinase n=1 Tax=Mangrovactinospora gilvigrisea TaxID=1428644 RepID=A0A1J7BVT6_9ACTN|nr:hypothetical protein BIV57_10325 [Mangrovactinospora gilvigrisea]
MARKIGSRYTIERILGRGSAGTVWSGSGPDGPVAVKLLREDLASDPELVGRFVQERTALTSLDHPRIVAVRDLVVDGTDLALVMELVPGRDLRALLDAEGVLVPARAAAVVADVAEGLAAAHAAGVVHRDVKPENVLLEEDALGVPSNSRAKLTDFGIARLVDTPRRTRATRIIGTPDYLAPEVIEGLQPRAAVDVYALATVLYELLCGATPFGGGHPGAVLRRHVTETVPPLPGLPDGLAAVLNACLSKAPAGRLTAAELADRLHEQLPDLAGAPALELRRAPDEEGADGAHEDEVEAAYQAYEHQRAQNAAEPGYPAAPRGAVPLVPGAELDEHDTHLRIRRPTAEELAAGPPPGAERRKGTGSHARPAPPKGHAGRGGTPAVVRRRRRLYIAVAGLLAAAGIGAWAAGESGGNAPAHSRSVDDRTGSPTPTAPKATRTRGAADERSASPRALPLPSWQSWTNLPAAPVPSDGSPAAVRSGSTTFVFTRDSTDALWYTFATGGGTYAPWSRLTGIHVADDPAAAALPGGGVRLIARGTDDLLYERTLGSGRWTPWTQVDGRTTVDSSPAAVGTGARVDAVARTGGDLVTASWMNGRWSAWAVVPASGKVKGTPAVAAAPGAGPGTFSVFVQRASDGQVLWLRAQQGAWLPPKPVTGLRGGTGLAASVQADGTVRVFARQADGTLKEAVTGAGGDGGWRTAELAADATGAGSAPGAAASSVFVAADGGRVRVATAH